MGVGASQAFDEDSDDSSHLLQALQKADYNKALQIIQRRPRSTDSVSPTLKARMVHSAIKRGNIRIIDFLRSIPGSSLDAGQETPAFSTPSLPNEPLSSHSGSTSQLAGHRRSPLAQANDSDETVHSNTGGRDAGHQAHPRDAWVNAVDRRGRTPLVTAVLQNRLEFIEGLISLNADPWAGDRRSRITALHMAAWLGHAPVATALLGSLTATGSRRQEAVAALCNAQDSHGFTPLHYAATAGHADVAAVLLDAGASYTASSQLLYDPSRGHPYLPAPRACPRDSLMSLGRRFSSNLRVVGAVAGFSGGGFGGGGRTAGGRTTAVGLSCCAPRSNPLHLAALRGDGTMVSVILERFFTDTQGLSRAARERVTDPRRQLNKDGFQPYMLAGNAGHWHVAQLLVPRSRDEQPITRDRDFLIFFPLPDPTTLAAAAAAAGGGPPSLAELASRAWAAKLFFDVREAENVVRQHQRQLQATGLGAGGLLARNSTSSSLVGRSGQVLGTLLRRSLRSYGGGGGGRICSTSASGATAAAAAAAASAAAAAVVVARGNWTVGAAALTAGGEGGEVLQTPAGSPHGSVSGASTPRLSASGGSRGGSMATRIPLPTSSRGRSLDLIRPQQQLLPCSDAAAGPTAAAAAVAAVAAPASPQSASPQSASLLLPLSRRSPPLPSLLQLHQNPRQQAQMQAASPSLLYASRSPSLAPSQLSPLLQQCDVCFEQPQEVALRPCPHRLCASCCRRVVEMHCGAAAPAAAPASSTSPDAGDMMAQRGPAGRRVMPAPPRCPFCQATIRGFAAATQVCQQPGHGPGQEPQTQRQRSQAQQAL